MPFGNLQRWIAPDCPQHFHIGVALQRRTELALMACATDFVEDHATNIDVSIETQVSVDQRRNAPGRPGCVDHEYNRG